jgi:predicted dehydrogenase
MGQLTIGIIGMGFIGASHIEAARRIGGVRVGAVADANVELAKRRAEEYGIPRCYADADEMIADPDIQAIHNCTPNHLHFPINEKIIRAGKHLFSEKPLGKTSAESAAMLRLLREHPDVIAGVNFCYRMNPLIQDAKNRVRDGEIGTPYLVHGQYLQDWLLYDTDYNWRVESAFGGPSRCVADIGSHWMDLAQCVLGSRIVEVCAATRIVLPVRKKSLKPVETFSKAEQGPFEEVPVDTEDYAGALLRFENGVTGLFQCSQVSAGRKCNIALEIDGSEASFAWQHETSDRMWKGYRDRNTNSSCAIPR